MMEDNRVIGSGFREEEEELERSLRPQTLAEYCGQSKIKESLTVYMQAAMGRREPLDHLLLYGPPGLGKTTLAGIIASEMGHNIRVTSGPAIERPGDLASILDVYKRQQLKRIALGQIDGGGGLADGHGGSGAGRSCGKGPQAQDQYQRKA